MYSFVHEPTGSILNENGDATVYYHDTQGNWFEDTFDQKVSSRKQNPLTLNELLADENSNSIDLNKDGNIGDTINSVLLTNKDLGIYRTVSNSLVIDDNGLDIGDSSVSPTL